MTLVLPDPSLHPDWQSAFRALTTQLQQVSGGITLPIQDAQGRNIVTNEGVIVYDLLGGIPINGTIVEIDTQHLVDAAVEINKIKDGAVGLQKFGTDLWPVQRVDSLPPSGSDGEVVFLSTDKKLYRWDSGTSQWTASVSASDLSGTITETQITDGAITTPKLGAGVVTAANIAAGTITANELSASELITSSAQIGDAVILTAMIGDAQIVGAKILDGTIQDAKIANLSAGKIGAGIIAAGGIFVGADQSIVLDGSNNEITANDALGNQRLKFGRFGVGDYGVRITNAAGDTLISATDSSTVINADAITTGALNAGQVSVVDDEGTVLLATGGATNALAVDGMSATLVRQGSAITFRNGFEDWERGDWTADGGNTLAESAESFSGASAGLMSSTETDPSSGGTTGGVRIEIPEEVALAFGGQRVKVTVYAKLHSSLSASPEFAVAYSTSDVGNSGWQTFTPTSAYQPFSFVYDVPEPNNGGVDFLGIWADTSGGGGHIVVDNVSISATVKEAELDALGLSNAVQLVNDNQAASIAGQGSFATLNQITSSNAATYIAAAAIGDAYIANLSAGKITAGTLAAARIGAGTITADKLGVSQLSAITADLGTITAGDISALDISADQITAGTLGVNGTVFLGSPGGGAYIRLNADGEIQVYDGSRMRVWFGKIGTSYGLILDGPNGERMIDSRSGNGVNGTYIQNASITNAAIANGAITNAKIANLDAGKITTGALSADRIDVGSIQIGSLSGAGSLAEKNSVDNADITSLNGNKIVTGSIAANKLNVSQLSAITADLGTITAGDISALNISANQINAGTLDASQYLLNGSVVTNKLATGCVTTNRVDNDAITSKGASNSTDQSNSVTVSSPSWGTLYAIAVVEVQNFGSRDEQVSMRLTSGDGNGRTFTTTVSPGYKNTLTAALVTGSNGATVNTDITLSGTTVNNNTLYAQILKK